VAIRSTANAPVYATANGTVEFSGELEGYGSAIRLNHGNEIQTIYGNIGRMNVSPKAIVTKGQVIGFVVAPMNGSDPELLYEVRIAGVAIDPLAFLGKDHAN
jgi:murein DD-endopeptidase MepM/ murein hydrolase activator NlpD